MTAITIEREVLRRLIFAWDSTMLPKGRDKMMQEFMQELRAALAAPATAPEPVAWLRAGAGLYCGYQTCEVNDENGFPVYRHPPATAPAQPDELEQLRKDAERYRWCVDNNMVLAGGTTAFGWPIAPVGREEWDRYIDYTKNKP
ncbi:MAG: hypothetical protein KAX88_07805 [Rhodoferax sp.]|nr:hypothetical protein [Rhodoferax sp.]